MGITPFSPTISTQVNTLPTKTTAQKVPGKVAKKALATNPKPSAPKAYTYTMSLSLNILKHLGFNLYSNIPAVISEAVANAWDADSENVAITLGDTVIIQDDGTGMTVADINNKFLKVGYPKRKNPKEAVTPIHSRDAMGRKGIGKLSLFSLADIIEVHSIKHGQKCALRMSGTAIEKCFSEDEEGNVSEDAVYHPEELSPSVVTHGKGTKIILTKLKRNVKNTDAYLRRRIARKFTAIGTRQKFNVTVDGEPITIKDRDFYKDLQFIWFIGDIDNKAEIVGQCVNLKEQAQLDGLVNKEKGYKISGWIGSVIKTTKLSEDKSAGETNNKISLLARRKVAQDDILNVYNNGSIYAKYLVGEIEAEFLEIDNDDDIATSNRQAVIEDDPRYESLRAKIYELLKKIQKDWDKWRDKRAKEGATTEFPVLEEWYNTLPTITLKNSAKQLFAAVQNLHFDKEDDEKEQRRELYRQGILAFEKLHARKALHQLDKITSANDIRLAAIFSDLDAIEAVLYHDIASERVAVIDKLVSIVDENQREKFIQKHIFDNLWLLNPSWDRATEVPPRMEQRFKDEAGKAVATLTAAERKARYDIKYRAAGGKHVIIELKRYDPSYQITLVDLLSQCQKYESALKKCLATGPDAKKPIEIICVLGKPLKEDESRVQQMLAVINARVVYIDNLIEEAQNSYKNYLKSKSKISKLRDLLDSL